MFCTVAHFRGPVVRMTAIWIACAGVVPREGDGSVV